MRTLLYFFLLFFAKETLAQFPIINPEITEQVKKNLRKGIDTSQHGELTLASFNIRNLGNTQRSLKDFETIVGLIDEADIVLFQEVGLGLFGKKGDDIHDLKRLEAIKGIFQAYLGSNWKVMLANQASGTGSARESVMLAHRVQCKGFRITSTEWLEYVDISIERDMALFRITIDSTYSLYLGSVHLTPKDPMRGAQMQNIANWMLENQERPVVVMGDFNWGYQRSSGVENYVGENYLRSLHQSGKIFQPFYHLSYLGKAKEGQLRTNMGFRKGGYFYDQFLTSPAIASEMAEGGIFLEDCGIYAYDLNMDMKKRTRYWEKRHLKGLEKYIKTAKLPKDELYKKILESIHRQSEDFSTYILSDHRVIWMQIQLFE
ncbi:MAG: hypothetical protein GY810_08585 [Aureispira sp.]|nr:hypothetical protein [Aureispira sp.]